MKAGGADTSRLAAALLAGVALLGAASTGADAKRPPARTRVTLISDSVAAAIVFDMRALTTLGAGVDLFLEPGQARRLGGVNPADGIAPPTLIDLVPQLGKRLGQVVVVCIGNNDISSEYAANLETALAELRQAGVQRVVWTTLHESPLHRGNTVMNAAIHAAATAHPELAVVDWNAAATSHPEWLQPDGVHLVGDGPRALAQMLHAELVALGVTRTR